MVLYGETVVLAAVLVADNETPRDLFPLQVEYRETVYAAGKIPGGFFKREGRPSEKEILSARLTDRPIRPLFDKGFTHEVQAINYVISSDTENDSDILAVIGSSAALSILGIYTLKTVPFRGSL